MERKVMTMTALSRLIAICTLLLSALSFAWSSPTGAASCPAAKPAVGGPHLEKAPADADLDLGNAPQNFTLTLNGSPIDMKGGITSFPTGESHTLELTAAAPFKGFLFRLGPQVGESEWVTDFTRALSPQDGDANVRIEETYCVGTENVGGVTHTNSNEKTKVSAVLRMDEPYPDMIMDITIVIFNNNNQGSEFYHSIFSFSAIDPNNPTTEPPQSHASNLRANNKILSNTLVGLTIALAARRFFN